MSLETALQSARDTRQLDIGAGTVARSADVFRRAFGTREAVLIADVNTWHAAGQAVERSFTSCDHPRCNPFCFTEPELLAEHTFVERLEEPLRTHAAIPVAVGAGTINDIVKLAAHRTNRPYMCVATAASMDGYTAYGASITYRGSKQTFPCPAPRAVLVDLDVIATAPAAMNAAGYADLLAKLTAGADWIVADALGVEAIDPIAWGIVQHGLGEALGDPNGVARGKRDALAKLVEGLMMSGLAMQAAKSSRPASGAEHQISHLWDMEHHTHEGVAPSHGLKVGVATVAIARLYEQLIHMPLEQLDVDAACAAWPSREQAHASIRDLFSDDELRNVALRESMAKYVSRDELREQLQRLRTVWPDLTARLWAQVPPPRDLAVMLERAGAPTKPEQIGVAPDRLRLSFYKAFHIRRRFTILDLAVRANVLDNAVDRITPRHRP
jgi:glycerol-1-phosphate dehydrogenase [NAD(P)+]